MILHVAPSPLESDPRLDRESRQCHPPVSHSPIIVRSCWATRYCIESKILFCVCMCVMIKSESMLLVWQVPLSLFIYICTPLPKMATPDPSECHRVFASGGLRGTSFRSTEPWGGPSSPAKPRVLGFGRASTACGCVPRQSKHQLGGFERARFVRRLGVV